jgi:hypothetical protein
MNAFIAIVFARLLSRLGYQMARSPVLPTFAADLGALPELIGVIVAASTITGVFFKLPSSAASWSISPPAILTYPLVGALGVLTLLVVLPLPDVDRAQQSQPPPPATNPRGLRPSRTNSHTLPM